MITWEMADREIGDRLAVLQRRSDEIMAEIAAEHPLIITICELDTARQRLAGGLYDHALSLISPGIATKVITAMIDDE